jgi:LmbE family N-acetylglucosaminyl deacetylase
VLLAAAGVREREAVSSAAAFLKHVEQASVVLKGFRDGFFPWVGAAVKEVFEDLKGQVAPDLVIVPRRDDAHQDHRLVAELTWNTFGRQPWFNDRRDGLREGRQGRVTPGTT